jgi:hypothetical protein
MNDANRCRSSALGTRLQPNGNQLGIGWIVLDEQRDEGRRPRVDYAHSRKSGMKIHWIGMCQVAQRDGSRTQHLEGINLDDARTAKK